MYNFFFDIDGTLISGSYTPSDAVIKALRYARSNGCRIFLNTGRTKITLPPALTSLDCIDGFCCGCGTYIEYAGKPILEKYVSAEDAVELVHLYKRFGVTECMYFEGVDDVFYCGEEYLPFADIRYIKIPSPEAAQQMLNGKKINKFTLHFKSPVQQKELFSVLSEKYQIMPCPTYYEIIPKGFDKGKAIELTEKLLGLDRSLSVAVGDSANDIKMLEYTPISVAMGNATDDIKALCTMVTDTVKNDGVAKLIYDLVK